MRRALTALRSSESRGLFSILKRRRGPGLQGPHKILPTLSRTTSLMRGNRPALQNFHQAFTDLKSEPRKRISNFHTSLLARTGDFSKGNQVSPFFDGAEVWLSMWKEIQSAQSYIGVSTFIIEDDFIGRKTIEELTNAAKRGCKVVFIYDYFGSLGIRQSLFDDLRKHGGVVLDYRNFIKSFLNNSWTSKWESPFHRVHQKLLVIDGRVGFVGGMNIGSDYASAAVGGTGRFRDTHCRVEGPAVQSLEKAFLKTVKRATKDWEAIAQFTTPGATPYLQRLRNRYDIHQAIKQHRKQHSRALQSPRSSTWNSLMGYIKPGSKPVKSQAGVVQVLESYGDEDAQNWSIQESFLRAIQNAKHKITISTPYFMPPPPVEKMLISAAQRGVQITIMTQGKSDVFVTSWAAQYAYTKYLKIKGFRIHELVEQELHAKTAAIDNTYASIGSDNLDHISWGYNREAKVTVFDPHLVDQVRNTLEADTNRAKEITEDYWHSQNIFWKATAFLAYRAYHFVYPWKTQNLPNFK